MRAVSRTFRSQAISKEEERKVFEKYKARGTTKGLKRFTSEERRIADRMLRANTGLLIKPARTFAEMCSRNQHIFTAADLEDFVQEGQIGQMIAILKFEKEYGCRFTTYSNKWAYSYMQNFANGLARIRGPRKGTHPVVQVITEFEKENRRTPTIDEIREKTGLTREMISAILEIRKGVVSAYDRTGEFSDAISCLPDKNDKPAESEMIRYETLEKVHGLLARLDERERDIIMRNFGFEGEPENLNSIGKIYGISRERVRQIKEAVLDKMRKTTQKEGIDVKCLEVFE
ncbi:sigma-70 family RNA polymerase sigma factor [Candidatus Micrarchaeota archaeon]|nr:sigma-70 family RNA polymerase sigma factor [Candidatus Micrarchaeota archaeon]